MSEQNEIMEPPHILPNTIYIEGKGKDQIHAYVKNGITVHGKIKCIQKHGKKFEISGDLMEETDGR